MKTKVGRKWYQSIQFGELYWRQVSFSGPQWIPSREEYKRFQRPKHILTLSQQVGLVIFLSGKLSVLISVLQRRLALKNNNGWRWDIFVTNKPEAAFFFCKPMGAKIWRLKMREIRQASFSPSGKDKEHFGTHWPWAVTASEHRRCNVYSWRFNHTFWDTPRAAQLQRRSSDAVTELVLRCSFYWPNRLGKRQNIVRTLKTFMLFSWWWPSGTGKGHLPARQFIKMDRLIPVLTHLSFH